MKILTKMGKEKLNINAYANNKLQQGTEIITLHFPICSFNHVHIATEDTELLFW